MITTDYNTRFEFLGTTHLIFLGSFAVLTILFLVFKDFFLPENRHKVFTKVLACCMLLLEIYNKYFSYFLEGKALLNVLPLHLCGMTVYILIVALLFDLKKVIKLVSYWLFLGTILALAIADISYVLPNFRVIEYMCQHYFQLMVPIYYIATKRISGFNYKHMLKSFGMLCIVAIPVYIVDKVGGVNFMYLNFPPQTLSMFDNMGALYIPALALVVFAYFNLVYLLLNLKRLTLGKKKLARCDGNDVL